jgi:hypothetical protein
MSNQVKSRSQALRMEKSSKPGSGNMRGYMAGGSHGKLGQKLRKLALLEGTAPPNYLQSAKACFANALIASLAAKWALDLQSCRADWPGLSCPPHDMKHNVT